MNLRILMRTNEIKKKRENEWKNKKKKTNDRKENMATSMDRLISSWLIYLDK